jgi:hypothetical protein
MKKWLTVGIISISTIAPVTAAGPTEMVAASRPLQCVPHARALSGLPRLGPSFLLVSKSVNCKLASSQSSVLIPPQQIL